MSQQLTMNLVNKDEDISKIRMFIEKIKAFFRKHKNKNESEFEKKVEELEKKLEGFEKQDSVHSNCLKNIAQTLEKITGVLEGDNANDISSNSLLQDFERINKDLEDLKNKSSRDYTISEGRIEDALSKAFSEDIMDKIYVNDENGNRVLSPDVKFFISRDNKKSGAYLMIGNEAVKISKIKKESVDENTIEEKIVLKKRKLYPRDDKFYLTSDPNEPNAVPLEQMDLTGIDSIEKAIGTAVFRSKKEYLKARKAKSEEKYKEMLSISGTADHPYEVDNYHCIKDDQKGYCIKNRHTNGMISMKVETKDVADGQNKDSKKKMQVITVMYSKVDGFDSVTEPIPVMTLTREINDKNIRDNSFRYTIKSNPDADNLMDTPMARKWLEACGVPVDQYIQMRNINNDSISTHNFDSKSYHRVDVFRKALEQHFRSTKGLEKYRVDVDDTIKNKTCVKVITPDKCEYLINFDKSGNIKNHQWIDSGEDQKPITVIKSSKNKFDKVLNNKVLMPSELKVCYKAVQESMSSIIQQAMSRPIMQNTQSSGDVLRNTEVGSFIKAASSMALDKSADRVALQYASLVKEAASYAQNGIIANHINGQLDDRSLVNIIMNEAEAQRGAYPAQSYRDAVQNQIEQIKLELSKTGVVDNVYYMNVQGNEKPRQFNDTVIESSGIVTTPPPAAESRQTANDSKQVTPRKVTPTPVTPKKVRPVQKI